MSNGKGCSIPVYIPLTSSGLPVMLSTTLNEHQLITTIRAHRDCKAMRVADKGSGRAVRGGNGTAQSTANENLHFLVLTPLRCLISSAEDDRSYARYRAWYEHSEKVENMDVTFRWPNIRLNDQNWSRPRFSQGIGRSWKHLRQQRAAGLGNI